MELRKIVIAIDSFKGSMTSAEAADSIQNAILDVIPDCAVVKIPMADGGEGTLEAIASDSEKIKLTVKGPLGEDVCASYAIKNGTAVIEMAQAAGLTLVPPEKRNPMETSTFGVGQMIMDAGEKGVRKFLIGLGGSSTNDAGCGMLRAMGFDFGVGDFPAGKDLALIESVDESGVPGWLRDCEFSIACDVDTPFCGEDGAACVFAPQKGADEAMVARLDGGLWSFAKVILKEYGKDITRLPGAGAAGGMGGTLVALLGARILSGVDAVLDTSGFDDIVKGCDLVFTGEGRMDRQTPMGKVPFGVLRRSHGVPVVSLAGRIDDCPEMGFLRTVEISPRDNIEESMKSEVAKSNLYKATKGILLSLLKF